MHAPVFLHSNPHRPRCPRSLFAVAAVAVLWLIATSASAYTYVATSQSINSSGQPRSYVLAKPSPMPQGALPLVISFHGDGGMGAGMRGSLPLEAQVADGRAVFVYPNASNGGGGTFEYWTVAGRQREATLVQDLIDAVDALPDVIIDRSRVYLTGFSGGATLSNALGCYLESNVIRKLGIHSGSLYQVSNDCPWSVWPAMNRNLPGAIVIWGQNDNGGGTAYPTAGISTRDTYTATLGCAATTTPAPPSPCVAYQGCNRPVNWCAIPGMGHSIWNSAATAMWDFFKVDEVPPQPTETGVFANGFENSEPAAPAHWVGGYFPGYESALLPVANIDFSAITHLFIGRLAPKTDSTLTQHFDIDNTNGPIWAQSLSTAAHAASRKAILMIGGAGEITGWRAATATPQARATFVANLLAAVDTYGADGLDLDWEPLQDGDHAPLLALAQALRAARPNLLLTIPVEWVNTNFQWVPRPAGEAAFFAAAAPVFDQINVMSYEMGKVQFGDGWQSWFASALRDHAQSTPASTQSSVAYYRSLGIPAAKLGIGIGFYGNCYHLATAPRQAVQQGESVISDGAMSYKNILASYLPTMTSHYDAPADAPWLSSVAATGPQGCKFVSYENPQSIAAKGQFAGSENLGGTILWTIGQGHLPSQPQGQRDPLLQAVKQAFLP